MSSRIALAGVFAAALGIASPPTAALVEGVVVPNDLDPANARWGGVVSITTGTGTFSGALIDSSHVLTAAHVVRGNVGTPANVVVNVNHNGNLTSQIAASQVFIHYSYDLGSARDGGVFSWPDDVAVVRLSQPVPAGVPSYPLFRGTPGIAGVTRNVAMVGYGGYADGISPTLLQLPNPSIKRVGQNRVDVLFSDDDTTNGPYEVFMFDFDGPTSSSNVFGDSTGAASAANLTLGASIEAGYAGGDSGSPVFIIDNGIPKLVGIGAFNGDPASIPGNSVQFGAVGGGMLIAPYADWIEQQTALPVPEPESYALMLVGIGLVVLAARRQAGARG